VPDLGTALAAVRAGHPSLDAARARVQMLAAELGAERMARIPDVSIRGFTLEEPERRAHGGALALDLPLWNWNSGRIAQARAQLEAGRRQLEWETREIESVVIEVQGACLANTQTAIRYRDRILPRSESAALIMEKTYRLGEASLLEVIDARRVLVETRLQYLAVLLQAQLDCSHLNALIGQEDAP
jgi:cobalt-zinc-cadmium efflux system outer membrane protein